MCIHKTERECSLNRSPITCLQSNVYKCNHNEKLAIHYYYYFPSLCVMTCLHVLWSIIYDPFNLCTCSDNLLFNSIFIFYLYMQDCRYPLVCLLMVYISKVGKWDMFQKIDCLWLHTLTR